MFSVEEIMNYVPHRYPFLLIDRVLDFTQGESVIVLKNVSINEYQFQGHFPSKPILPGVYIIESMAQAACFLLAKSAGKLDPNATYFLGKVLRMSFKHPVLPGDQLITTVTIDKQIGENAAVNARSTVDETVVAKGELAFAKSTE
jgi:3-hydroxyacyl-[acyl-carrier-protein] dehydratase